MLGCLAFKKKLMCFGNHPGTYLSYHAEKQRSKANEPLDSGPWWHTSWGFPQRFPWGKFPTKNWSASWGVEIGGKPTIFKETPIYRDILIWCRYIHNMYYIQWYINICSVSDHRWEICIYTGSVLTPGVHPKAAINEQKRLPSLQHRHTTKSKRSDNTM